MKKSLILAVILMAMASSPRSAAADPGGEIVRGSFSVSVVGQGKVTGTGINCPGECSSEARWRDDELPPTNRLTATETIGGWTFQGWSAGCEVPISNRFCDASYGELGEVVYVARFADTENPWVALGPIPRAVVNGNVAAGVTAADNDRVSRMEYLVDGVVHVSDTNGPWPRNLDVSAVPEGEHTLQARAFDPAGNSTTSSAQSFRIDRTPPEISLDAPVTATNAAAPSFSFTSLSPDLESAGCDIVAPDAPDSVVPCEAGVPFTEEVPDEGAWRFRVVATDQAGNQKATSHDFVVDRTAPELAITSGPADGATVEKGDIRYDWTVSDGLGVTQMCSWDDAAAAPCDRSAAKSLLKGDHGFALTATDLAGNVSTLGRTVKVLRNGTNANPDPDPEFPVEDRTAPVIRLTSPKQRLKALKKGLKVTVSCSEACSGTLTAKATRPNRQTRGIKLTGRVGISAAGTAAIRLMPSAKAKRKLKRIRKPLKLTVVSKLADASGNAASFSLKTKVRK
ncbi:MAG TPA: Ig-like domain-containing protein [Solirubrobacterales bacterium]|nr:Ig-like domain-containing protein [Solirubrobacterales bacterium]